MTSALDLVPCLHKYADHRCGTHARYVLDQCRCDQCRAANATYERRRRRWTGEFAIEPHPLVNAAPVRRRLRALMRQGMGPNRIAEVSGVPHGAVSKLLYGTYASDGSRVRPPSRQVRRETAAKLEALELDVADGAKVDATEAKAIVAELVARGWRKVDIGRRIHGPHARSLQAVRTRLVMAGTLRVLRCLLAEPVPVRMHPRWGTAIKPKSRTPRHVAATTPGVPAVEISEAMTRTLRCWMCREPLADHALSGSCASAGRTP